MISLHCLLLLLLRPCEKLSQDMWIKTIATHTVFINLKFVQMLARGTPLTPTLALAGILRFFKSLLTHMSG